MIAPNTGCVRLGVAGLVLLALTMLAPGCAGPQQRSYYTLTYPVEQGRFADAFDATIRVREVGLRESYRRPELVQRPDVHELRYLRSRRWSERPQKMLTARLIDHLRASNLVTQVDETMGQTPPDYTLGTQVEALEQVRAGDRTFARLAVRWQLVRFSDDKVVWSYRADRQSPVGEADASEAGMRATVRAQSDLLQRTFDEALDDMARFLAAPDTPRLSAAPAMTPAAAPRGRDDASIIRWSADAPANDLPQVHADKTPMGVGFGAIFVPALSGSDREPPVAVFGTDGVVAEQRPGQRVVLEPGVYDVRFGNGVGEQQITAEVQVEAGRTTVIPPTWSTLQIDVVDEQFVPFRGTYELIRMDDRDDYGIGFGADEQLGEQVRVWALPAGLYKIIRAGGTYRDRTNFATVRLVEGEAARFTLVLDEDTGDFVGAGEVDPDQASSADEEWTLRGVVGGALSFNETNQVGQQEGSTIGATLFFDGATVFRRDAHLWQTRLELEEEQAQAPEDSGFVNETDRLFFHTIYTYVLVPWFGPYARAGLETQILPRYQSFEDEQEVTVLDPGGAVVKSYTADQVRLGGSFAPLQLREGTGGNFRVLRKRNVELDLRLGIGALQNLSNGLLTYDGEGVFNEVDDSYITGFEGTVVGFARPLRWVTISTEFDGLLAFDRNSTTFTWRNQVSLRLSSFASLNYRFNLAYEPTISDETQTEHDVQLRFSYTLF